MITYRLFDETENFITGDKRIWDNKLYEATNNMPVSNPGDMTYLPVFNANWNHSPDTTYFNIIYLNDTCIISIDVTVDDITFILPNPQSFKYKKFNFIVSTSGNELTIQTHDSSTFINNSKLSVTYPATNDNVTFFSNSTGWQVNSEVIDKLPLLFSCTTNNSQTFIDTRINVNIDKIIKSQGNIAHLTSNEIIFDENGLFIFSVSCATDISSGSSRSTSNAFLQIDTGSGFIDVSDFKLSMYNRMSGNGISQGSQIIPINISKNDKIRLQVVRADGSDTLMTIPNGTSITVFMSKGLRGEKGVKGDSGNDGDLTWEGTWSAGSYDINQTVQYQGSSFVCITNGTVTTPGTPSSPNTGWELLCEKGVDGSGTSINISDSNVSVPNSPFSTINFTGDITATDAGSSIVDVNFEETIEYMIPIWAEENNSLGAGSYEWAFGNGANTPSDGGITIFVPSGYSCEVVGMSLRVGSGTATVELVVNGVLQGSACQVQLTSGQGIANTISPTISISSGDYINFHTLSANSTSGPCVVTAWLRYFK